MRTCVCRFPTLYGRARARERERDRQTDKDRETDRQTDEQTDKQRHREREFAWSDILYYIYIRERVVHLVQPVGVLRSTGRITNQRDGDV